MSNYPPGTGDNDPKAPWNQIDLPHTKWEFCHVNYCKKCDECCDLNEDDVCENCFEPEDIEDDE